MFQAEFDFDIGVTPFVQPGTPAFPGGFDLPPRGPDPEPRMPLKRKPRVW